ncbi:hypothetical protein KAR26_04245 [Candidatus Parcubacteria bacterium]|nr:hypothetical protein [Candidatus Parcubacteria bacterium]
MSDIICQFLDGKITESEVGTSMAQEVLDGTISQQECRRYCEQIKYLSKTIEGLYQKMDSQYDTKAKRQRF